ncbi:hypothetical protein ACKWTF_015854 [Chironomus riparius]
MDSSRLIRSKSSMSFDQLKVRMIQDKIAEQYSMAQRRPRQKSLRIIVLKKNYRKRLAEEINEKNKMQTWTSMQKDVDQILKNVKLSESNKDAGKLSGGRCLIKPSKFTTATPRKDSGSSYESSSSSLRRTKSFSEKRTAVELKRSKLDSIPAPKPFFNLDRPVFDLSKPVNLSLSNILSKIVPPTPTKQKPEPEPKQKANFGFSGRSLFQSGKPQKIPKMTENTSTFYLSSEAALSHTAKIDEMNEKMRYVKQLEKEFNENKIKRQRDEEEEKEQKSKRRLSFGKSPVHSLVCARREE